MFFLFFFFFFLIRKINNNIPDSFCYVTSWAVTLKDMAGEPLFSRMFGDEAEVVLLTRMKSAERDVL